MYFTDVHTINGNISIILEAVNCKVIIKNVIVRSIHSSWTPMNYHHANIEQQQQQNPKIEQKSFLT